MSHHQLPEDAIDTPASLLVQLVKAIPGFKLVQMGFKEALLTVEVEADGAVIPQDVGEDGLRALIVRGFSQGILVVIRQYILQSQEVRKYPVTGPKVGKHWISIAGVVLNPGGRCCPLTAEQAEEHCSVEGYEDRTIYKDFKELIPQG
jgi:hypothetical protein